MNTFYKYLSAGTRTNSIPNFMGFSSFEGVLLLKFFLNRIQPIDQINFLKDEVGFNISEIAEILLATRPSVYKWLNGDNPKTRHQERLDDIYFVLRQWKTTDLGPIAHISRRKFHENVSLFTLLCSESIDSQEIFDYLNVIENNILEANLQRSKREHIQATHNYPKVDEKEAQKALDRISKKIG